MQARWQARYDSRVRVIYRYLCAGWMRLRGLLELSVYVPGEAEAKQGSQGGLQVKKRTYFVC